MRSCMYSSHSIIVIGGEWGTMQCQQNTDMIIDTHVTSPDSTLPHFNPFVGRLLQVFDRSLWRTILYRGTISLITVHTYTTPGAVPYWLLLLVHTPHWVGFPILILLTKEPEDRNSIPNNKCVFCCLILQPPLA